MIRPLKFFKKASTNTLLAWYSQLEAALSMAEDCVEEVELDMVQFINSSTSISKASQKQKYEIYVMFRM